MASIIGPDYADHSQGYGVDPANFRLINVNAPDHYSSNFTGNVMVSKATLAAKALLGDTMVMDYMQLLEKVPGYRTSSFAWHQDMQYWPKKFPEGISTRTATFSLALTDADEGNGCLRVVPASGVAKELFKDRESMDDAASSDHSTATKAKEEGAGRAIVLPLTADELASVKLLPVRRGDVTVHDEWIVHGSGPNPSDRVRKTYVVAFREAQMVKYERQIGFTHSYRMDPKVIDGVRAGGL